MKVHYYRYDRLLGTKWLPKLVACNDAKDVFMVSFTWLAWSWLWRFPDTAIRTFPDGMTEEDDRRFNRQWDVGAARGGVASGSERGWS